MLLLLHRVYRQNFTEISLQHWSEIVKCLQQNQHLLFSLTASQAFKMKPNLRDALVNHTVIISSSKTFHQISTHHFPLPPCLSFWIFLSYPLMLGLQRVQQTSQQESSENPPCAKYFQHSHGCLGYTLAKEPCHL